MIYVRNIFKQDLRDGKQIAFPTEPSNVFFHFDFHKPDSDRKIKFIFKELNVSSPNSSLNNKEINTRLYAAGSESRIDGQLKAFLRDDLNANIDDIVVFNYKNDFAFEFSLISKGSNQYKNYKTILGAKNHEIAISSFDINEIIDRFSDLEKYVHYLTAIRTKPFILLAGISGTGKSRLVRELAFMSCPKVGRLQDNTTTPGNYCMIEVKPNWHDSSELLGYTSGLQGKYIVTPFVKFLVKAMRYPEVPFFVCLDEMNLAPVEQYFAEYLSVLETRKVDNDKIVSGSLINKDIFQTYKDVLFKELDLYSIEREDIDETVQRSEIEESLLSDGLRLPQNVIVVGTVNMDDTTHQFSRKVIDRAMTFEMNHLDFSSMFENEDKLMYTDNPLNAALFISDSVTASQALELIEDEAESLKTKVIDLMEALDGVLKDTPFRVAYRVQNELVLYCRNLLFANQGKSIDELFPQAADALLTMKVLPRIEGDEDMVDKPLNALETWTAENNYTASNAKIKEMLVRLNRSHYTSYWP